MRVVSCILLALGICLLASAAYDEIRGSTTKPLTLSSFKRRSHNSAYLYSLRVTRQNNPRLFHEFMVRHWYYAAFAELGGCILFLIQKNQEDPVT